MTGHFPGGDTLNTQILVHDRSLSCWRCP